MRDAGMDHGCGMDAGMDVCTHTQLYVLVLSIDSTPYLGTASTGNDGGSERRGFRSRSVITHRRTTHEGLKVPPNAPDGLVVSYIPLI